MLSQLNGLNLHENTNTNAYLCTIIHHSTNIWMTMIVCTVLIRIRIKENADTAELVLMSEYTTGSQRILHVPERHSIAK